MVLAFLMVLAFMLLLPVAEAFAGRLGCLKCHKQHYTASGNCISCHRGDERSDRLAIAHRDLIQAKFSWFAIEGSQQLVRGEKLLVGFACLRCHVSGGKGNSLASNLDRLPMNTAPEKIYESIKSPALFMPDFSFDDLQITDLVNTILAGGKKPGLKTGETPQVVHFEDAKRRTNNIFETQCGSCHKILSETFGALGKGKIGPDLSGFFSEFYPANLKDNGRWTAAVLKKWLENPRKIRENSQMRPVTLKIDEFEQLKTVITVKPKH